MNDFVVGNDNPELFSVQPDIGEAGQLVFTPADGMSGVALVSVQVRDSGGTRNGGQDTSERQWFMIKLADPTDIPTADASLMDFLQSFSDRVAAIEGFRQARQLVARLSATIESVDVDMRPASSRLGGIESSLEGLINGGQLSDVDGQALLDIMQAIRDHLPS
jgi:hypothetical protein